MSFQKFSKVFKSFQKLSKVFTSFTGFHKFSQELDRVTNVDLSLVCFRSNLHPDLVRG